MSKIVHRLPVKPEKHNRFNVYMSDEADEQLRDLMNLVEGRSRAEVVRNALRVYHWMVKRRAEGTVIGLKRKGERRFVEQNLPVPGLGDPLD